MRKLIFSLSFIALFLLVSSAFAENYNYTTAEQLKELLTSGQPVSLLDIQYEGAYKAGHFPQAIATYAYPVKKEASRAMIDAKLSELQPTGPVVILSRRGGGGAMRAYDHLKSKGVDETRLLILKNGMQDWPYADMVEVTED